MTNEDLQKLRLYAILTRQLDKYVYLREDEQGRYIEYAFKEGAPHDNRCLSWYVKPHPKYNERHGGTPKVWANIDEIYKLSEYACGLQNIDGGKHCCAGHPKEDCSYLDVSEWTYDEPIKCACWTLSKVYTPDNVNIPIDVAIKLENEIRKEMNL